MIRMKRIIRPEHVESTLTEWKGGAAKVWMFDLTFNRLAIRVLKDSQSEILYVAGVGCRFMNGPFSWDEVDLVCTRAANRKPAWSILDRANGFELRCESVALMRSDKVFTSFAEISAGPDSLELWP
jgi:hypothetical protein